MKEIIVYILLISFCFLWGCNCLGSEEITNNTNLENIDEDMCVSIIVNGKNIDVDYPCSYHRKGDHVDIPLLTVFRELGATVTINNKNKVKIIYGDKSMLLDTRKDKFGIDISPGTTNAIRKVYDGELIVDSDSASMVINGMTGAMLSIDRDTLCVYIDSPIE